MSVFFAQVEGIASNGSDVWIVDAGQDRVYRYANAASRLSGSQNATSYFALNSGNLNPKDIVTDGTHLWITNDTTSTDKVFKYTLSGSLVGSWTINAGGTSPTGITLDPSGASQSLWIVDSTSDRVYEYTDARGQSSGSQTAAASFALAAGNTNPQGIADPPAPIAIAAQPRSNSQENGERLLPASSHFPIVFRGQPAVVVNRGSNESKRPANLVESVLEELPTVKLTNARHFSSSELVSQPAGNQATVDSEKTSKAKVDSAFTDVNFDSFDEALLGLLAENRM